MTMVMERISRKGPLALLQTGTVQLVEALSTDAVAAAAFARLGCADVRVYAGGKQGWAEAGPAFEGSRATIPTAGTGRTP
ncbi:hypothetical protein DMB42_45415 [Nonomuraea sp. WAC 01424]|uniref:hypothetical protein n=1 Tax=Nonomuraea sp. WAC 01424 TaxID=2203200 RepID=UPI000F7ADC92|nr:hypothetical protein [Nonomuraea sp. WAC 01424]RSM98241.1 hypothetical protein DMB42_45415 [Nonomuraea sp. WAC 01424]